MKNMGREKFEESLKNAFDKAEINPSEKVWTNIELELEKEKGGDLQRRLMIYKMLAAASVVFAMAVGGVGFYYSFKKQPSGNDLAFETPGVSDQPAPSRNSTDPHLKPPSDAKQRATDSSERVPSNPFVRRKTDPTRGGQDADGQNAAIPAARVNPIAEKGNQQMNAARGQQLTETLLSDPDYRSTAAALPLAINDRALPPIYRPRKIPLTMYLKREQVDPVAAMLARLEQREREMQNEQHEQKDKKDQGSQNENLWTSIGFAAGSFNTLQSSGFASRPSTMALTGSIVDQETKASGYSYAMGANVGMKLSARWVLQGGVNYLTHSSDYTANNVVVTSTGFRQQRFTAASTNEIIHSDARELSNKIVYSAPYNVNNSMRYLSIPMQAGYLLIDRTFGLQLNAGVATDLFLQNTVTPDSDNLERTSQAGGSDSPYRSLNLSGLLGTEFSYRFGEHYRLSLNPGIRYPFNTIYKAELGVQASPLTFDVGLRFRYIFH